MSQPAIRVEGLGKRYRIGLPEKQPETLREAVAALVGAPFGYLRRMLRPPTEEETLWALRDVSFEVQHGEVVGLIGRNGAGKSTLLKILTRITEPTEGRAVINGRLGSLLEVGTGFHPELTGRENVFLNGAILGMRNRETKRLFDEIVDFADVEKFIDTPVKRYSSGMYVRLAFAVASHLQSEILLIDEVLAVGDAPFRKKCLAKIKALVQEGRTVLFVSHEIKAITELCQRTILLRNGIIAAEGETGEMIEGYLHEVMENSENAKPELSFPERLEQPAQILGARVLDDSGHPNLRHHVLHPITVELDFIVREPQANLAATCQVKTTRDDLLFTTADVDWNNHLVGHITPPYPKPAGRYHARLTLPMPLLIADHYELTLNLLGTDGAFDSIRGIYVEVYDTSSFSVTRKGQLAILIQWHLQREALSGSRALAGAASVASAH